MGQVLVQSGQPKAFAQADIPHPALFDPIYHPIYPVVATLNYVLWHTG